MIEEILNEAEISTVKELFLIEHFNTANKLGFISTKQHSKISYPTLIKSIGIIDKLTKESNEYTDDLVITMCGIIWIYKNPEWDLLHENLILFLSRIGYSPSAIMIDENYNYKNNKHSALTSYLDELFISIYNYNNEIYIQENKFLLTKFQKKVWDTIEENRITGISAPTSAGKSFVILLKTIDLIIRNSGDVLYVVPTLTLISQVTADFNEMIKSFGIKNYEIVNTYSAQNQNPETNYIYVLTQERAISSFAQVENPFNNVNVFVVDEIQNIERINDYKDLRAKTLYDLLIEYRHINNNSKIIISGPRIEKIGKLGKQIFGEDSEEIDIKSSPVVNLTYSISKEGKHFLFKQYSSFNDKPFQIEITNKEIVGYGAKQFNSKYNNFIKDLIQKLGDDSKNIIFSPNSNQARKIAIEISQEEKETNPILLDKKLLALSSYLAETVHENYSLIPVVENKTAYHHGKLPHHVRFVIERAIKDKIINNVVCTTTLMQGVNLPTQNVIIRNPNLFIKKRAGSEDLTLTKYEIANLSGRAGRLLKDFIGRTFVLDEDSFKLNKDNEVNPFEKETKKLDATYGNRFNENRSEIINSLITNSSDESEENKFITRYIRYTVLKHGEDSSNKLKSTGIELSEKEAEIILKNLKGISVPTETCLKNRYWDPLDLDRLFFDAKKLDVPTSIKDKKFVAKMKQLLLYFYENFPQYYNRYVKTKPVKGKDMLLSLSITAHKWAREVPLKSLLKYSKNPEDIEKSIHKIQNEISYGIPVLLKPLYDILFQEHSLLTFIEMGAFKPITRRLIEFNIPRESAVILSNNFDYNEPSDNDVFEKLRELYPQLDYWVQVQLEPVI